MAFYSGPRLTDHRFLWNRKFVSRQQDEGIYARETTNTLELKLPLLRPSTQAQPTDIEVVDAFVVLEKNHILSYLTPYAAF